MAVAINRSTFNIPGLGRLSLEGLKFRGDYLAADLYGREKPTLPDSVNGNGFLADPHPTIPPINEIRFIYNLTQALETISNGEQVTLSTLDNIKQYFGGELPDEIYELMDIPGQINRAIDGMNNEIAQLQSVQKPQEMDPGVNILEDTVYSPCRRQVYLNLRAQTFFEIMEKKGEQEQFIQAAKKRLQTLNEQFDKELAGALSRLGSSCIEECMKKAMHCVELSELDHP